MRSVCVRVCARGGEEAWRKQEGNGRKKKTLTQSAFSYETINPRQQESKQAKQLAEKHTWTVSDTHTE